MELTTNILSVTSRVTNGGRTLYDVACGDGVKRTVWEAPLASALQAYAGQPQAVIVDAETTSRQGNNGQTFTNHNIRALIGVSSGQAMPTIQPGMAPPPAPPLVAPVPFTPNTAPIQPAPPKDNFPPETTTRITKMGCLGYAATLVAALYQGAGPEALAEATEAVVNTAKTFYDVARSHEKGGGPVINALDPQGALTTPQAIAAAVPGVQVGAPVQAPVTTVTDDVPWD